MTVSSTHSGALLSPRIRLTLRIYLMYFSSPGMCSFNSRLKGKINLKIILANLYSSNSSIVGCCVSLSLSDNARLWSISVAARSQTLSDHVPDTAISPRRLSTRGHWGHHLIISRSGSLLLYKLALRQH